MTPIHWQTARGASAADVCQARMLGDWLRRQGWTLHEAGRWADGWASPRRVRFGWDGAKVDVCALTCRPPRWRPSARGPAWCAVPDDEVAVEMQAMGLAREQLRILPYPVPDLLGDWTDAAPVFSVTRRYHLQARPRLVAAGDWSRGQALTRLFPAVRSVLPQGGEVVLLEAADRRSQMAPLAVRWGIQESVVMLPRLSLEETAGLFHSADIFCQMDGGDTYPHWLRWAVAAGLPAVAADEGMNRRAVGSVFLAVAPGRDDAWPAAVTHLLGHVGTRETLIARGRSLWREARLSAVGQRWEHLLADGG